MTINQNYDNHAEQFNVVIFEHKGEQIRLTVSEFLGNLYLGMRVWLLDINDEWFPTKSGFSFPYNLHSTARLFGSLAAILSESEVLNEVQRHSKDDKANSEVSESVL